MFNLSRVVLFLLMFSLTIPVIACGTETRIVKKPEGLLKKNPNPSNTDLTTKDRMRWKSVLNWCDECDKRAKPFTQSNDGKYGGIFIYPIGDNQYIIDIQCYTTMRQSEHIYYKITENADTIKSRLLKLEQFYFDFAEGAASYGIEDPINGPQGEFIRFTDTLVYGKTHIPDKNQKRLAIEKEYRSSGGCGLYTIYDVSGDTLKIIEFRAKPFCSAEGSMPSQWKIYPPELRSKWRIAPNPARKEWDPSTTPACSK